MLLKNVIMKKVNYRVRQNKNFATISIVYCQVGSFNKNGKLIIHVYPNEGPIAHMHIEPKDACVKIEINEYFIHGKHIGTLTKKEEIALYDCLHFNADKLYKVVVDTWNRLNHQNLPLNEPTPRYDLM